jgi:hypothetical protein
MYMDIHHIFFPFLVALGFELRTYTLSHPTIPFLWKFFFRDRVSRNYVPRLASNPDPAALYLPNNQDYRQFLNPFISGRTSIVLQLLYPDLHSFTYMSRRSIAGSYGSSIFSFLRNLYALSTVVVLIYIPTNSV